MAALTLTSTGRRPLRPLLEAAIENQLNILQAGIEKTTERLQALEREYDLSSAEFIQRYEKDELAETLAFVEWVGECRMLIRLPEKAETLQGIRFAD